MFRGALLFACVLASLGCGARGQGAVGEACTHREQCSSGLCVAGLGQEDPRCTRSCRSSEDCPEGWSCSGVTDENVVICQPGAATPFGR